jgi:transketolase
VPSGAKKVVFEAGVTFGWKNPFDDEILAVGIDRFGESGPYQKIAEHLGVTAGALEKRIRDWR